MWLQFDDMTGEGGARQHESDAARALEQGSPIEL